MITEIFIEGKPLDVNDALSNLITFSIDDVKDFGSRETAFSKTIVLPGTGNNNIIFGAIFDTGIANDYDPSLDNIGINFNAAKSARCVIFQDNLQTFKGTLRLLEIVRDRGRIEYEAALNGELTSLSVALSSKLLTDLDFSEYNVARNVASFQASWDNPGGSGVFFPLIDYGNYSLNKNNWQFGTFRPALYVKEYIDKMFAAANFRYSCNLFNTNRFKKLVIPHNQKEITKPTTGSIWDGYNQGVQLMLDRNAGLLQNDGIFDRDVVGGLFSTTDNKTFTYNGTSTIQTEVSLFITNRGTIGITPPLIKIFFKKNGAEYYYDNIPLTQQGANVPYTKDWDFSVSFAPGDTFSVHYSMGPGGNVLGVYKVELLSLAMSISAPSAVTAPVEYGGIIEMNYSIPQNIRQVDFLLSIVKLFNLYVYESRFDERLILIAPFIDFYESGSGSAVDWTYKINRDEPIKIKPLSELNSKIYQFAYRDDSDYYNDLYKKRYNQGYGTHIYDTQYEFATQTKKLELIFAPTPIVGYSGEVKLYSTIFKQSNGEEERIDSVIRILQTKKITGVPTWKIQNGATELAFLNSYGYAGHFDDPDNPGNDLNFGITRELFFLLAIGDLTKNQFNLYWSGYMAEITDKDSKLVTAKFYLTPKDIFELDFAKYVYLDGSLYRLNKIVDYNASMPDECEVQLLKVIQTAYSFPPGSEPDASIEPFILWMDGQIMLSATGEELMYE